MIQSAEATFHYYDLAVNAFLSGELDYTNEIIDNKEKIESLEETLSPLQILGEAEKQIVIQLCGIIDNIARISKFAADIAELTIDRSFKR